MVVAFLGLLCTMGHIFTPQARYKASTPAFRNGSTYKHFYYPDILIFGISIFGQHRVSYCTVHFVQYPHAFSRRVVPRHFSAQVEARSEVRNVLYKAHFVTRMCWDCALKCLGFYCCNWCKNYALRLRFLRPIMGISHVWAGFVSAVTRAKP